MRGTNGVRIGQNFLKLKTKKKQKMISENEIWKLKKERHLGFGIDNFLSSRSEGLRQKFTLIDRPFLSDQIGAVFHAIR